MIFSLDEGTKNHKTTALTEVRAEPPPAKRDTQRRGRANFL